MRIISIPNREDRDYVLPALKRYGHIRMTEEGGNLLFHLSDLQYDVLRDMAWERRFRYQDFGRGGK